MLRALERDCSLDIVAHAGNPGTKETDAGSGSWRPACTPDSWYWASRS